MNLGSPDADHNQRIPGLMVVLLRDERRRRRVHPGNHDVDWNTAFKAMAPVPAGGEPTDIASKLYREGSEYRWDWRERKLYRVVDANRAYLAEWLPWAGSSSLETIQGFLDRAREQADQENGFQAAIIDASGAIVGIVGFHGIDWNNRSTSIGYWLAEARQGRGTMSEAVRALVTHAFDAWRLNRVEIRVAVGNDRSAGIPERLGFVKEGVLREAERHGESYKDNVVYSMLASEWSSS